MCPTFIYSFRTNKFLDELKKSGIEIFVFGRLKEDFDKFQKVVKRTGPKFILGLAEVRTKSRFETLAINAFGKRGKVNKNGKGSYRLYIPPKAIFPKSRKATTAFCNWTMYKLSEIADKDSKVSFLHFNSKDLSKVIDLVKNKIQ